MSRATQVEAALKRLDQAGFQRLADAYLMKRGYDLLIPIGLSLGSEKTAVGTPDALVPRADGTYVLAEYTTQQKGLAGKFANDLASCAFVGLTPAGDGTRNGQCRQRAAHRDLAPVPPVDGQRPFVTFICA